MARKDGKAVLLPPAAYAERRQLAREDWKKFLFSMCKVVGIQFAWFNDRDFDHLPDDVAEEVIERHKRDVPAIMVNCCYYNIDGTTFFVYTILFPFWTE